MTTLATAILELAKAITHVREGTCTANGTTTTLIDTAQTEPDSYWLKGTLWFLTGAAGILGKTAIPSAYTYSNGTITFPAQAATPATGNRYAVATQEYSRADLVKAINQALSDLGELPQENTTLVTVAEQEEYDLPAGVRDLRRVEIARSLAAPYAYQRSYHWQEIVSGKLRFDPGRAPSLDGYTLRLTYSAAHAEVNADADVISDYIPLERLRWAAAVHAMRTRYIDVAKEVPGLMDRFNEAKALEAKYRSEQPIPEVSRDPHFANW
jgi:hypothetical protein